MNCSRWRRIERKLFVQIWMAGAVILLQFVIAMQLFSMAYRR